MGFAIAIDGPAGAGKSTIAKIVAGELGYVYIDTGAMYRAIALYCINKRIDFGDEKKIETVLRDVDINLSYEDKSLKVFLCGEDVTTKIREEKVGMGASKVSKYAAVREKLTLLQRKLADDNNVVMDGRDIGTTVLPNARLKIYLTAGVDARARRRFDELVMKGVKADMEEIKKDIKNRDEADMNRKISPLRKADDAVLIDSSDMTIEEVVDSIRKLI